MFAIVAKVIYIYLNIVMITGLEIFYITTCICTYVFHLIIASYHTNKNNQISDDDDDDYYLFYNKQLKQCNKESCNLVAFLLILRYT